MKDIQLQYQLQEIEAIKKMINSKGNRIEKENLHFLTDDEVVCINQIRKVDEQAKVIHEFEKICERKTESVSVDCLPLFKVIP